MYKEAEILLNELFIENGLNFEKLLTYKYFNEIISYQVPKMNNCQYVEGSYGAFLTFSNIPFADFIFIHFSMLLEYSILFMSENLSLLTSSMLIKILIKYLFLNRMTFYSLFKPLKWPYPIIFNLPESLLPLLSSPIPIIFGIKEFGILLNCLY